MIERVLQACHREERLAAAMIYRSLALFFVGLHRRLAEAWERLLPGARAYLQDAL
jgi:hypothetical protein